MSPSCRLDATVMRYRKRPNLAIGGQGNFLAFSEELEVKTSLSFIQSVGVSDHDIVSVYMFLLFN